MPPKALVTGAAKRIGREIALQFAKAGYDIVLHYCSSENEAFRTQVNIQALGVRCELWRFDLDQSMDSEERGAEIEKALAGVTTLVHSASLFYSVLKPHLQTASLPFFNVHYHSAVALAHCFWLMHSKNAFSNPNIIFITDAMMEKPSPDLIPYYASKAALRSLAKLLAMEYAPRIRVNAVAPGSILFPEGYSDVKKAEIEASIPMKRSGMPQDIANACLFLANAPYVTGQEIKVDGGRSL